MGGGTRFRVLLPSSTRTPVAVARPSATAEYWTGSGTVLVVDDDEGVRDLIRETLCRANLTVLTASDGHEAVEIFRRHADEIRAVVLDRTMPTVDGEEAFGEIRRIRPDARIILTSGYSEERAVWEFLDEGRDFFLHKPFEPMELVDRIRRILEGS